MSVGLRFSRIRLRSAVIPRLELNWADTSLLTRRFATASPHSKAREYSLSMSSRMSSEVYPGTSFWNGGVAARFARRPSPRPCIWLGPRYWIKTGAWLPFLPRRELAGRERPLDQRDLLRARGVHCRIIGQDIAQS